MNALSLVRRFLLVWVAIHLLATGMAVTASPTELSSAGFDDLGKSAYQFEDSDSSWGIDTILSAPAPWQKVVKENASFGYSDATWWLKYEVSNPQSATEWVLEVAYPVLDFLDVYIVRDAQIVHHHTLGDNYPFKQRPIDHHNFLIPLSLTPNQPYTIILKVRSSSAIEVSTILWRSDRIIGGKTTEALIHGLFLGGLLIIALYNLLIYTILKERAYLYYVAYIFFFTLFVSSLFGWNFQFFWPENTAWNDRSILFFLCACLLFGTLFSCRFLCIDKPFDNWIRYFYSGYTTIYTLLMGLVFILPYGTLIRIIIPNAIISCSMGFVVGVYAWREGRPSARYYTLAWSLLFAGGIILALSKGGYISKNAYFAYALQAGSLLEVLLFSFALADRINLERALRIQAQADMLQSQKQANLELGQRVIERTEELELANRKLKYLINTDQLTGLKNRRFLDTYLEQEFARSQRYKHAFSVILIDIDHFKKINDNYGHSVGDHCIKVVANVLLSSIRNPSDAAARYGGEEFCMVLPETNRDGAIVISQRMRQTISNTVVEINGITIRMTCSFGIHSAQPKPNENYQEFIDKADTALYQSKRNGRNMVSVFDESQPS